MQTVIAFMVVFGSLVFFHELGHFVFAKRAGIMVREFAIGFGPKVLGITKGETLYTIRLLPLGGYVRMAGEDFDKIELQPGHRVGLLLNKDEEIEKIYLNQNITNQDVIFVQTESSDFDKELFVAGYDDDDEFVRYSITKKAIIVEQGQETLIAPYDRQFESKSLWKRTMTIFAGPLFNFILAFFIFIILGLIQGVPKPDPIISEVVPGSAYDAGMMDGDLVIEVEGKEINSWNQFVDIVQKSPGEPINVVVERAGDKIDLEVTPAVLEDAGMEFGQIGVIHQPEFEKSPVKAVVSGAEQTISWIKKIIELLGLLVTGQFTIEALSGPVGIYKATETVAQFGVLSLMSWGAVLSINLGIMNLLPLPALDGGRLLFFFFEALRGKPIDKQKEGMVHFVGIVLLMILMIVVTWNDIQKFFF